jgi:methylated-DNA-[protein]-cysteine S-methyltransferase
MNALATIDSPIGPLTIVASETGVRAVLFAHEDDKRAAALADGVVDPDQPIVAKAARQLREWFEGRRRDFDLPLDLHGTAFQVKAWHALATIPYGETISYGQQATRIGEPNKARAIGAANGRNPIPIVLPCHRVIGSNGALTGYAGGLDAKRLLLQHEADVMHMLRC